MCGQKNELWFIMTLLCVLKRHVKIYFDYIDSNMYYLSMASTGLYSNQG